MRDTYVVDDEVPLAVPPPPPPAPEPPAEQPLDEIVEQPPPTWYEIWAAEAEQTEGMLLAARAQAEDVRRQSQTEGALEGEVDGYARGLERGRAQGYAEGHAQGHQDGHAEAVAEAAGTLHTATQVAASTRIERKELLEAVDSGLVDLVIGIARRVIQTELTLDPSFVRQCVQTALRAVADSPMAMLHINPEDAEILQETWDDLRQRFGDGGLQLVPDARIPRGGCIVDAESRTVDAQIDSKLEEIQRQFLRMTEPRT